MSTITIPSPFVLLHCRKCGIAFAVPDRWDDHRRDDSKPFWCPNGHGSVYGKGEPGRDELKAEVSQLKAERIQLIHDRDMADARAASAISTPEAAPEPTGAPGAASSTGGGCQCPHCPASYRSLAWLNRHIKREHEPTKPAAGEGVPHG